MGRGLKIWFLSIAVFPVGAGTSACLWSASAQACTTVIECANAAVQAAQAASKTADALEGKISQLRQQLEAYKNQHYYLANAPGLSVEYGSKVKPTLAPVSVTFQPAFKSPPVVIISAHNPEGPGKYPDNIGVITASGFTVISSNAWYNYEIDWIAIGER